MTKHKADKFCSKCGEVVSIEKVGAERYTWWEIHPLSPYDIETGERQFVRRFFCPNARWYNNHDDYMTSELIRDS